MTRKRSNMDKKGMDLSRKTFVMKDVPLDKIDPHPMYKNFPEIKREGVFEHIYKCTKCGLHFKVYSWQEFRHTENNVYCPECGQRGGMIHNQKTLSTKKDFDVNDGEHEIFGVHGF